MNWDALGAVGEIVGAVGVVATLAYLAVQIRTNNTWQKRQGFRDALKMLAEAIAPIGENSAFYNRGCDRYDELDEDERLQFHVLITNKYAAFELFFDFHKSQDIKDEAIDGAKRWMRSDFARPGVRAWWDDVGRQTFSVDFHAEVDKAVEEVVTEAIALEEHGVTKAGV